MTGGERRRVRSDDLVRRGELSPGRLILRLHERRPRFPAIGPKMVAATRVSSPKGSCLASITSSGNSNCR